MSEPLVSVVTATFGAPRYLRAALESALGQTLGDLELLVGDDSADEETRALVESLGDRRLRYFRNERTLGPSANHRRLFARSRGRFLTILNQDDLRDRSFLERLVAGLEAAPSAILAFCDHWIVDSESRRLPAATEIAAQKYGRSALAEGEHRPFFDLFEDQTIPLAMGSVFRNDEGVTQALPDRGGASYDLWLSYLLARTGRGALYLRERLAAWRVHDGQLGARSGAQASLASARCWWAAAADPALAERSKPLRARGWQAWRSACGRALRTGDLAAGSAALGALARRRDR